MFKKLRNRLMFVNMLITSVLLLGCFCFVFGIMWQNVKSNTDGQLMATLAADGHRRNPGAKKDNPDRNDLSLESSAAPAADSAQDSSVSETMSPQDDSKPQGNNRPQGDNPMQGGNPPQGDNPMQDGNSPQGDNPMQGDNSLQGDNSGRDDESLMDMTAHFVVLIDSDGNISDVKSPFEMEDESYTEYISEILEKNQNTGIITYAGGYWKYMKEVRSDGTEIAFISYTSERRMLFSLAIILLLVWFAALAAAFFISLKNANASIKPVEDSYNRQKQFVADASHELRTPLTTINTNVDVLLSHKNSTIAEEEKWLGYIKGEAVRMSRLTNDLLCLTRLDHTKENDAIESASFSDACENVLLTMEAVIFEKNIAFEYDIEEDITVNAPDTQLKQLVMILLDNASKYTPEKGKINMILKRSHGNAVLKVRNTGDGISEEDRKHIFERFYRTDKSRARESGGYGLGLAIAQAICQNSGGEISVESQEGEYTEFKVKLPLSNKGNAE